MRIYIQITTDDPATLSHWWQQMGDHAPAVDLSEEGEPIFVFDLCTVEVDYELVEVPEARPTVPMIPSTPAATQESPPPAAAGPAGGAATMSPAAPPATRPQTCGQAIVEFLASDPDVVFTTEQITDHLCGRYKESTVKFTLSEIARAGDITRTRPGIFQAKAAR